MSKKNHIQFALDTLEIHGFRIFKTCKAKFHPTLNVLIAPNSGGKTAFLDALAHLLKSYASSQSLIFNEADKFQKPGILFTSEIGVQCLFSITEEYLEHWGINQPKEIKKQDLIEVAIRSVTHTSASSHIPPPLGESLEDWMHSKDRLSDLLASKKAILLRKKWGHSLDLRFRHDMPLMAYFTANRRIAGINKDSFNQDFELTKSDAFLSLLPCEGLGNFDEWLRERAISSLEHRLELEEMGDSSTPEPDSQLIAVSGVLSKMLSHEVDIVNVKYFASSKSIQAVKKNGSRVNIEQLSHGAKSVLTIAAEIAMNCCALNPHLKEYAPTKTPGVILIDEIDLHLHPRWQQHVLGDLQECFPCMQFIVTTHSPAVLTTVRKENIREISVNPENGTATISEPVSRSYGESSGDLQETIMGVSARPDNASVQKLNAYLSWAENGNLSDDKSSELTELISEWGSDHADLLRAEMIIKRRQILSRKK